MNTMIVLSLVLAAAASTHKPARKPAMLADADARPRLAAAATAKPMRLVEEPPPTPAELMTIDREKLPAPPQNGGKPIPFPAEPPPSQ